MDFDPNKFCSSINAGLFLSTDGDIKTCCAGDEAIGYIKTQPIKEIFSSKKFIEIKSAIDHEKQHSYCRICDEIGKVSPGSNQRFYFNNRFPFKGDRKLRMIDIRWSTICNLSCRYCDHGNSSEWKKVLGIPIEIYNKDHMESIFEEVEENKNSIVVANMLGGEPLLQKYNLRLLDILNKDTEIEIISNGNVNLENNKIYEKLKKFDIVRWHVSFENVGDRFEYVRHNSSWDQQVHNLKKIRDEFDPEVPLGIHSIYNIWSATDLSNLYQFADELGQTFAKKIEIHWQMALPRRDLVGLDTSSFFAFGHGKKFIELAINEIDSLHIKDDILQDVKKSLVGDLEVSGRSEEFIQWCEKLENIIPPKKTFRDLWPEVFTAITNK